MAAIWKRLKRGQPKCIAHGETTLTVDRLKRVIIKVGDHEVVLDEGDLMEAIQQKLKSLGETGKFDTLSPRVVIKKKKKVNRT